jgi:hypothetical protein
MAKVSKDMDLTKPAQLIDSNMHTFLFTAVKKEADAGMRKKTELSYKIVSMKQNNMTFTCSDLKDLARNYAEYQD